MGKKDEEIAKLNKELEILKTEELNGAKVIERQKNQNQMLTNNINQLTERHQQTVQQFQEKFKEMQEHKSLMILTVNVTGVADINKTLNDSVALLKGRLNELGMEDDYQILAVPHTMSIGIRG